MAAVHDPGLGESKRRPSSEADGVNHRGGKHSGCD